MEETTSTTFDLMFFAIVIIGIVIQIAILRYAFMVKRRSNIEQAQLFVLMKIAQKQGVEKDDLAQAASIAEGSQTINYTSEFNHYTE